MRCWVRRFDNGWKNWISLGGELGSKPSAVCWGPGRIDAFVVGVNSAVHHKAFDGQWAANWDSRGGQAISIVAPCSWGPGRLDIFVVGIDYNAQHNAWDGVWHGWENRGGIIHSPLSCVSRSANHIDLVELGTNSAMFHQSWS